MLPLHHSLSLMPPLLVTELAFSYALLSSHLAEQDISSQAFLWHAKIPVLQHNAAMSSIVFANFGAPGKLLEHAMAALFESDTKNFPGSAGKSIRAASCSWGAWISSRLDRLLTLFWSGIPSIVFSSLLLLSAPVTDFVLGVWPETSGHWLGEVSSLFSDASGGFRNSAQVKFYILCHYQTAD